MEDRVVWMAARHIVRGVNEIGIATNSWQSNVAQSTATAAKELSTNCTAKELDRLLEIVKAAILIVKPDDKGKKK